MWFKPVTVQLLHNCPCDSYLLQCDFCVILHVIHTCYSGVFFNVFVCNWGEGKLMLNFVCPCRHSVLLNGFYTMQVHCSSRSTHRICEVQVLFLSLSLRLFFLFVPKFIFVFNAGNHAHCNLFYINVAFWGCHTYAKCVNTSLWFTGGCHVTQHYLQTVISAVDPFLSLAHTASPVSERQNVDNSRRTT